MKLEAVPQDESHYEGHKRLCYATDAQGRTVRALSQGWEVETIVTARAIERLAVIVDAAWARVADGTRTPLHAALAERQSDARLVACESGLPWLVVTLASRPRTARAIPLFVWPRLARALAWNGDPLLLLGGVTRSQALAALSLDAPAVSGQQEGLA